MFKQIPVEEKIVVPDLIIEKSEPEMADPNSNSKYCPLCERLVVPKKKIPWNNIILIVGLGAFSWFYFGSFWNFLFGIFLIPVTYSRAPAIECPICNAKVIDRK